MKNCIDHDEATIRSYMRDPDFANYMLQDAEELMKRKNAEARQDAGLR